MAVTQKYAERESFWLVLKRESGIEFLYFGMPGEIRESILVRAFKVKTGISEKRPTPLPYLVGREYWTITGKYDSHNNPETAPYFLSLDIPVSVEPPFGPEPYLECNGQCNWETPGAFGLHGVAGNPVRLSSDDPGSSGCIRHSDADITYLYALISAGNRYYVIP